MSRQKRFFVVCGGNGVGKRKLLQLFGNTNHANDVSIMHANIYCSPKFESYYTSRDYHVLGDQPKESSPNTFRLGEEAIWVQLPEQSEIREKLREFSTIILCITGTSTQPIQYLQNAMEHQDVQFRVIVVTCPNRREWNNRLEKQVIWNEHEIEKIIENGKWFVEKELPKVAKYYVFVDNDSSLEEGLGRFEQAIRMERVHEEDVDLYYEEKQNTRSYLQESNIQQLMEHLMTRLFIEKPENPKQFLIQELECIRDGKSNDIFEDTDIDAMFDMIDLGRTGFITKSQFLNSLKNLNASKELMDQVSGKVGEQVDREFFREWTNNCLKNTLGSL